MLKRRSLALTVYGYAIIAFVVLTAFLQWTFETLLAAREPSELLDRVAPRVVFLADEIVRAGPGTPAAARRITELEKGMAVRLTYVPWSATTQYPADLARKSQTVSSPLQSNPFAQSYWARIDRDGRPAGALKVQFRPQFRPSRNRSTFLWPLGVLTILFVIIFPPLAFWVVRPIRRLEAAAHRLGEGDLETPVIMNRLDELGRLASAFDTMRERLRNMLHERERLLTDVSHEIRGPLARMAVAQDLLEDDIGDNPYVARLRQEMRHLDELTGELLSLTRQRASQPPQWTGVALDALIRKLVSERDLFASQRQVSLTAEGAPANVRSDAALLSRALGNLLDNALKYTEAGGTVTISHRQQGNRMVVTIADDGPGIPAAALPHIFEPFYRPDVARTRKTGGTGLGLAIVRAIVDRLEGTIQLDSKEGVGTTVTVSLPTA